MSLRISGVFFFFFFSSRRRHTRLQGDWSSDVCSSDLPEVVYEIAHGKFSFWWRDSVLLERQLGGLVETGLVAAGGRPPPQAGEGSHRGQRGPRAHGGGGALPPPFFSPRPRGRREAGAASP